MIWKASLVLCLASCALSYGPPAISEQRFHNGDLKHIGEHQPEQLDKYAWAYPSYEFSYYVEDPHTHDFKGQHETRDGDKVTGKYWLLQPDGRKRIVKYESDHKKGFHAEVNYLPHEAHHPTVKKHHEHDIEENQHSKHDNDDHDKKRHEVKEKHRGRDHDEKHHDSKDDEKHDNKHDVKDNSWGWIKPRLGHQDHKNDDGRKKHEYGHSEDWRQGVLVGWKIEKDRADGHKDRDNHRQRNQYHGYGDDHRRSRDDRYEDQDDDHRGGDRRYQHQQQDRRGQHSYHTPIRSFKPLVPYGQRIH